MINTDVAYSSQSATNKTHRSDNFSAFANTNWGNQSPIEPPLDIIPPKRPGANFSMPEFQFDNINPPLGYINGKPMNDEVFEEKDLLSYLKDSYEAKTLVYCKQPIELSPNSK